MYTINKRTESGVCTTLHPIQRMLMLFKRTFAFTILLATFLVSFVDYSNLASTFNWRDSIHISVQYVINFTTFASMLTPISAKYIH